MCVAGGFAAAVLTEKERRVDEPGLGAVCDWFVTIKTRDAQPAGLNPVSVRACPVLATAGSVLS